MVVYGLSDEGIAITLLKGNFTNFSGHSIVERRTVVSFYFNEKLLFLRNIRIMHFIAVGEEKPFVVSVFSHLIEHVVDTETGIIMNIYGTVRCQNCQESVFRKDNLFAGFRESSNLLMEEHPHGWGWFR